MRPEKAPAFPPPFPGAALAALVLAAVSLGATNAAAQAAADDREAPSLSVRTDPETPHYSIAVTADPVGMFLGDYGARLDVALDRVNAIYVEPRWLGGEVEGLGIELAYRLFPLGEGLSGPFAALAAGVAVALPDDPRVSLWGGVDLGWQWIWQGIVLGASGGVGWLEPLHQEEGAGVVARVSIAIGYAFM
jgi:hypothetical protein